MSTYAQLEDYAVWRGQPIAPEEASELQFLLNEAEVELEVVAGDLGDRVTAELTTDERVVKAIVGMVGRVVRARDQGHMLLTEDAPDAAPALSSWLKVTRRERYLVGMFSNAGSLDLSTRDPQLVHPVRRPPYPAYDRYGYRDSRYCP